MKPNTPVTITAGTIANMTDEQFRSLRDNICAEGRWDSADRLLISGGDYIGVEPHSLGQRMMFIGIEKDGYTHS